MEEGGGRKEGVAGARTRTRVRTGVRTGGPWRVAIDLFYFRLSPLQTLAQRYNT